MESALDRARELGGKIGEASDLTQRLQFARTIEDGSGQNPTLLSTDPSRNYANVYVLKIRGIALESKR